MRQLKITKQVTNRETASLDKYLQEIGRVELITAEEEVELAQKIKAGDEKAWLWSSDGRGEFSIEESKREGNGTTVILHITKDDKEYLDETRITHVIKSHSDHIGIPIVFKEGDREENINSASALWTLQKKDIKKEQYKEFYHHVSHAFDDPWLVLHNQVEGVLS